MGRGKPGSEPAERQPKVTGKIILSSVTRGASGIAWGGPKMRSPDPYFFLLLFFW